MGGTAVTSTETELSTRTNFEISLVTGLLEAYRSPPSVCINNFFYLLVMSCLLADMRKAYRLAPTQFLPREN